MHDGEDSDIRMMLKVMFERLKGAELAIEALTADRNSLQLQLQRLQGVPPPGFQG